MALQDMIDSVRNFDPEQLNDFNQVGSWPIVIKLFLWLVAFASALALGYFMHVTNLQTDLAKVQQEESGLREDYEKKAFEAAHLEAYRKQQIEMEESFEAILRQLPSDTEIPGLIEDITMVGLKNGLSFQRIDLLQEVRHEFYVEKPIQISVSGSYHDISAFVSDVSDLSRIVTLHNFEIKPATRQADGEVGGMLNMNILARTYRYNDERG